MKSPMKNMALVWVALCAVAPGSVAQAHAASLRDVAMAALNHDARFAQSRAGVDVARYGLAVADAGGKFNMQLEAGAGRSELQTDAPFPESGTRAPNSLSLLATQPLYTGGRVTAERTAATHLLRASGEHLREVGGSIILSALTAVLDLKRDRETVKLARASHDALVATRRDVEKRFQAGAATRTDLDQADARVAEAKAGIRRAQARLRVAEIRLTRLIGPLPPEGITVPWPGELPTAPQLDDAISQSQHAPAVVAAEYEKASAVAQVRAAEAVFRPSLSLDAHALTQDDTEFGYQRMETWGVQLNLKVPVFTGGLRDARRHQALARALQAEAAAQNEAALYAETAAREWELLQASEAVIAATQSQVQAAQSALDGIRKELAAGSRTSLDLLNAERELLVAQVSLVSARHDRAVTAFGLLAACGILEPENVPDEH